jgi:NADH dehydrogenase
MVSGKQVIASLARPQVTVTGAAGFIGQATVQEAIRRGYDVVAVVRPCSSRRPPAGRVVEADILDMVTLDRAFAGSRAVIHLAAVTSSSGRHGNSFRVNVVGSHAVASVARRAGVEQFIYVGSQANNPGAYAVTKRKAEAAIKAAGVQAIVVRPSLVYGPGDHGLFGQIVRFVRSLPIVPLIDGGRAPMRPIHVDDVAAAIMGAVECGVPGTTYDISGETEILFRDLLLAIGIALGRRPHFVSLPRTPVFAASLLATRLWSGFPVTPDMIQGLMNPVVRDGRPAEQALAFRARPLDEGLRELW